MTWPNIHMCPSWTVGSSALYPPMQFLIYVKDYADAKFGCVPVDFHFLCHYRPRELPGRGTKGLALHKPSLPYGGKFTVAQQRHPGFFGLCNVWRRWIQFLWVGELEGSQGKYMSEICFKKKDITSLAWNRLVLTKQMKHLCRVWPCHLLKVQSKLCSYL